VFEYAATTEDHIQAVAPRLRQADIDEVSASTGRNPHEALLFSVEKSSLALTVFMDGRPEVIFGCGDLSILTRVGCPWALGTDAVERNYREFLRGSVGWRDRLLMRYSVLTNVVDERNAASIRWLRWLGFDIGAPIIPGRGGVMFRKFEMRTDRHV